MLKWDLELSKDIRDLADTIFSVNDSGDVCIVYSVYSEYEEVRAIIFNKEGEYLCKDKALITGVWIHSNNPVAPLGNDKWLFKADGIRCLNKKGDFIWGDRAVKGSGYIQSIATIDTNSFYFLTTVSENDPFSRKLFIFKCDREGDLLWDNAGKQIAMNVISDQNTILVDQDQNANIIFGAFYIYEPTLRPRGTYIQKVSQSGDIGFLSSVNKPPDQVKPSSIALLQNYPNPCNPTTTIQYRLPQTLHIVLKIYTILGVEITTLVDRQEEAGIHQVVWDGKDRGGLPVSTGLYIYRLEADEHVFTKKLMLIK
jgi:hypothetical protein